MINNLSVTDIVNHYNGKIEDLGFAELIYTPVRTILGFHNAATNEKEFIDSRSFTPVNKHLLIAELAGHYKYEELNSQISTIKSLKKSLKDPIKKNELIGKFYQFKQTENISGITTYFSPIVGTNIIPIFHEKLISNFILLLPNNGITVYNANPGFLAKIAKDTTVQLSSNPHDIKSDSYILTNSITEYYTKIITRHIEIHSEISKDTIFSLFELLVRLYFKDSLTNIRLSNDNFIYDLCSEDLREMTQSNNILDQGMRNNFEFANPEMNDMLEDIVSKFYTLDYSRNQDSFTHTISLTYANIKRFYQTLKATYGDQNFSLSL